MQRFLKAKRGGGGVECYCMCSCVCDLVQSVLFLCCVVTLENYRLYGDKRQTGQIGNSMVGGEEGGGGKGDVLREAKERKGTAAHSLAMGSN